MRTNVVPRGTGGWPAELDAIEAEQSGDTCVVRCNACQMNSSASGCRHPLGPLYCPYRNQNAGTLVRLAPDPAEMRRREIAAGYCHIDRLAVDGGALVEMPRRRRLSIRVLDGLICTLGAITIAGALVLGVYEALR